LCLFAHILWVSDQYLRYILASRFAYIRQKFLKISEAQEKEEILAGSQITQLFEHQDFSKKFKFYRKKSLKGILKGLQKLSRQ